MRTGAPEHETDDGLGPTVRSLALFAGLPGHELDDLVGRCDVSSAHPGQVVQAQDVPVRLWHVIVSGHAVVQRDGTPIALLGRGATWSECSLLNQTASPIAVVALSPLTLLTLSRRQFFEILEEHPVLAGRLVARSTVRPNPPIFNAVADMAERRM